MSARDRRILVLAAVATSAVLVAGSVAGHPDLLAYAAPLYLLVVPLLAGRYVGEEHLHRLQARRRRHRVVPKALPLARRRVVLLPRGGRLIAEALAVRPPPAVPAS